jgi:hypothetical protein
MVVTTVLWRYWQKQQYEEAITEVCALLDVKEESFSSDQELLAAAGDTEPIRPIPGSFPTGEAENLANLALFGCSCCNRLSEQVRKDWRVAAHWCALARCLEAAGDGAGPWAMVRFERLFHAAEAIRVAGKDVLKNDETGRLTLPDYHLRASHRCLRECESIWLRLGISGLEPPTFLGTIQSLAGGHPVLAAQKASTHAAWQAFSVNRSFKEHFGAKRVQKRSRHQRVRRCWLV